MKFLIKFPSRGRPDKFKSTFKRYLEFSSKKHDLFFVFTFDEDDLSMNSDDIKSFLDPYSNICEINYGHSQNKIEAINANLDNKEFDILVLASDDLIPCRPQYDDIIAQDFQTYFPDTDGSMHYNNHMWGEKLDIMCILGYKYFKRFNYIYHPDYKSMHCDNEFTDVKNMLNKNKFSLEHIFDHHFTTNDATASRNGIYYHHDHPLYQQRAAQKFGLGI